MAARISLLRAAALVGVSLVGASLVGASGCGRVDTTLAAVVDGGRDAGEAGGTNMRGPAPKPGTAPDSGGSSSDVAAASDVARECEPGARTCDGTTPVTCDIEGRLQRGAACAHTCRDGACTGDCTPGEGACDGNVPKTCNAAGQWEVGSACAFVCRAGACAGVCRPDARQCGANGVPQTCGAAGEWVSATAACPFLCKEGMCAGSCKPQAVGCSGLVPQTCGADGEWVSLTACPKVCSGGVCSDGCTVGAHQCSGTVPQTCDSGGRWQDGAACPFVCMAGVCGGICVPDGARCVNGELQTCDATGAWQVTGRATRELLANPAFDEGVGIGWTAVGQSGDIIYEDLGDDTLDTKPHTPSFLAWLGGYNKADDDLSQKVALPASAVGVTLSFYYKAYTREVRGGAAFDFLDVEIHGDGGAVTPLGQLTDNSVTSVWTRFVTTLPPALAGQTVELHFHATTDGSLLTSFYVDTVSLEALVCP